ncbi:MAG: hypothetical protein CMP23_17145, partial [Rickettsiales bacterium]|nr:hypothetical protein [Rickettsiales bacterium]
MILVRAGLVLLLAVLAESCAVLPAEGTRPGDCSDGADNDADGAYDCSDAGCSAAPICQQDDDDSSLADDDDSSPADDDDSSLADDDD